MDNIPAGDLNQAQWRRVCLGHGIKLGTGTGHVYKYDGFRDTVSGLLLCFSLSFVDVKMSCFHICHGNDGKEHWLDPQFSRRPYFILRPHETMNLSLRWNSLFLANNCYLTQRTTSPTVDYYPLSHTAGLLSAVFMTWEVIQTTLPPLNNFHLLSDMWRGAGTLPS